MAPKTSSSTQPGIETILDDVGSNMKALREIAKKDVNYFEKELERDPKKNPTNAQLYDRERARKAVKSGRSIVDLSESYEAQLRSDSDAWLNDELGDEEYCEAIHAAAKKAFAGMLACARRSHKAPFQMTVRTATLVLTGMVGGLKAAHELKF